MKTSNKIFIISIVSILTITTIFIIAAWLCISNNNPDFVRIANGSSEIATKNFPIKNFTSISASGFFELEIVKDNSYMINLSAPEYLIEHIRLYKSGDRLIIDQLSYAGIRPVTLKVRITMPELTGIKTSGNSKIDFSGFKTGDMIIELSGSSEINSKYSNINNLCLIGSGTLNIDLNSCSIVNANLNLSGSGVTDLNMAGGKLSGTVNGLHEIFYKGKISEQNVITLGSATIRKKE